MTDLTHSRIRSDMERRSEHDQRVLLNEILVELKSIRVMMEDARRVALAIAGDGDE